MKGSDKENNTEKQDVDLETAVRASDGYEALKMMFGGVDYISDLEALGGLRKSAKNRQADKARILQVLEEYKHRYKDESQECVIKRLISDYKAKKIEPRKGIHDRIKSLSRASLMRWRQQVRLNGWSSLAGNYKSREGFFKKYPQALNTLLALKRDFPKASDVALYKVLAPVLEKVNIPMVSQRTVVKELKKIRDNK